MNTKKPISIEQYIAGFPPTIRERLSQLRDTIKQIVPEAEETIKYQLPTFVLNENLVHFGGFKHHIGFYPTPSGIEAFKKELSEYKVSTGAVQFPHDKPLPMDLVTRIVKFRMNEAKGRASNRRRK